MAALTFNLVVFDMYSGLESTKNILEFWPQICKADICVPIFSTHVSSDVNDLLAINKSFDILKTDLTRHSLRERSSQFYVQ